MGMNGYRDLVAWQKSMELVTELYNKTKHFPKDELYGLTSQLRRAGVSIASNLAEGHGRNSTKEFHYFIGLSRGSLSEVETQLEIAKNLGYLEPEVANELLARSATLGRMLTGLRSWSSRKER
jgi:four helix bundle protein